MKQQAEEVPGASSTNHVNIVNAESFFETLNSRVGGRLVVDENGDVLEANTLSERVLRGTSGEKNMVGRNISELFGSEFAKDRIRLIRECIKAQRPLYFCAMVRGAWSHVLYEPLEDAGNGKPGVVATSYGMLAQLHSLPESADVRLSRAHVHDLGLLAKLTRRELQVLKMIGDGYSAAAIAEQLFRSKRTIQWHRASLGRKLGVTNRVMLAQIAYAAGLPEFDVDQVYDLLHNKKGARKSKKVDARLDGHSGRGDPKLDGHAGGGDPKLDGHAKRVDPKQDGRAKPA